MPTVTLCSHPHRRESPTFTVYYCTGFPSITRLPTVPFPSALQGRDAHADPLYRGTSSPITDENTGDRGQQGPARSQRCPGPHARAVSLGDYGLSRGASPWGHGCRAGGPVLRFRRQLVAVASECSSPALSKPPAALNATLRSEALGHVPALCPGPVILTEGLWTSRLTPSVSRRAVARAAGAAAAWRGQLRPPCPPNSGEICRFSRQEYWSGGPFPPPGDLPNPGIKPMFPAAPAFRWVLYR